MSTAIDWRSKPKPWNRIGAAFAAEVHEICGREVAPAIQKLPDVAGMQLRARMIGAKMKSGVLADRVGCSRAMINALLAGSSTASARLWARIDAVLHDALVRRGRASAAEGQRAAGALQLAAGTETDC